MGCLRNFVAIVLVLLAVGAIVGIIAGSGTKPAANPGDISTSAVRVDDARPADQLTISKTEWVKGGFGSIALLHLTFKNAGKRAVKDINLNCYFYGSSGTEISHTNVTVFETFPAGKSKRSAELNLGFIDSQVQTGSCHIIAADWA